MSGTALITGAAGFIGSNAVELLHEKGYSVFGIGHGRCDTRVARILTKWSESDVEIDGLRALGCMPDIIIHCAGSSSVAQSFVDPEHEYHRTLAAANAVLTFVSQDAPNASVVLTSSAAVYGHAFKLPIDEEAPLAPVSPYGHHKTDLETLLRTRAGEYGINCAIVRLFSIYGEGLRKQLLWDACLKFVNGVSEFAGTGAERRDWLHVSDATQLLLLAAAHASRDCPVVNGGTGTAIAVRDVLLELMAALGLNSTPKFTGVSRPGDPHIYMADITRARGWGWSPSVCWRDGIRRYAHWFSESGN